MMTGPPGLTSILMAEGCVGSGFFDVPVNNARSGREHASQVSMTAKRTILSLRTITASFSFHVSAVIKRYKTKVNVMIRNISPNWRVARNCGLAERQEGGLWLWD